MSSSSSSSLSSPFGTASSDAVTANADAAAAVFSSSTAPLTTSPFQSTAFTPFSLHTVSCAAASSSMVFGTSSPTYAHTQQSASAATLFHAASSPFVSSAATTQMTTDGGDCGTSGSGISSGSSTSASSLGDNSTWFNVTAPTLTSSSSSSSPFSSLSSSSSALSFSSFQPPSAARISRSSKARAVGPSSQKSSRLLGGFAVSDSAQIVFSETPAAVIPPPIDWSALHSLAEDVATSSDALSAALSEIKVEINYVQLNQKNVVSTCSRAHSRRQENEHSTHLQEPQDINHTDEKSASRFDECMLIGRICAFLNDIIQHHATFLFLIHEVVYLIVYNSITGIVRDNSHHSYDINHSHHVQDLLRNAIILLQQKKINAETIVTIIITVINDYLNNNQIPRNERVQWLKDNGQIESLIDIVLTCPHTSFAIVQKIYQIFVNIQDYIHLHIADKNSTYYKDTVCYERQARDNNVTIIRVDRAHFSRLLFDTRNIVLATADSMNESSMFDVNNNLVCQTIMQCFIPMVQSCTDNDEQDDIRAFLLQRHHVNVFVKMMTVTSEHDKNLLWLILFMCFARLIYRKPPQSILETLLPLLLTKIQALAQPIDNDNDQQAAHIHTLPVTDYERELANAKLLVELISAHIDDLDVLNFFSFFLTKSVISRLIIINNHETLFAAGCWDVFLLVVKRWISNTDENLNFHPFVLALTVMIRYQTDWKTFNHQHFDWIIQSTIKQYPSNLLDITTSVLDFTGSVIDYCLSRISDHNLDDDDDCDVEYQTVTQTPLISSSLVHLSQEDRINIQSPTHAASTTTTIPRTTTSSLWARFHTAHVVSNCFFPLLDDASFYQASRANRHTYNDRHEYALKRKLTFPQLLRIPSVVRAIRCVVDGELCDHIVSDVHYPRIVQVEMQMTEDWIMLLPHVVFTSWNIL